jgi:hypothetical protein
MLLSDQEVVFEDVEFHAITGQPEKAVALDTLDGCSKKVD